MFIQRFEANAASNFEVKKIEVDVEVAEQIDLTAFRGNIELHDGEGGGQESAEQKQNVNVDKMPPEKAPKSQGK